MAEILAHVRVTENGKWVVDLPLGDRQPCNTREQAEAFANAYRLSFAPRPNASALRTALGELQRIDLHLHNCLLARRIYGKLKEIGAKESCW